MAGKSGDDSVQLVLALMSETIKTFHLLRAAGKRIGAVTAAGAGNWGLLRSLGHEGPQTVPQAARARPVSRQHMQKLADQMAAEGMIEFIENPAHAKSMLMQLTRKGRTALTRLDQRIEMEAARLATGLNAAQLQSAVQGLREFRLKLAADTSAEHAD
ncbi:MAG: MarR family winged helix-turn-helix transcriptional regulator [Burkholderiales bacterium]